MFHENSNTSIFTWEYANVHGLQFLNHALNHENISSNILDLSELHSVLGLHVDSHIKNNKITEYSKLF